MNVEQSGHALAIPRRFQHPSREMIETLLIERAQGRPGID
jgi:hypothetical protein